MAAQKIFCFSSLFWGDLHPLPLFCKVIEEICFPLYRKTKEKTMMGRGEEGHPISHAKTGAQEVQDLCAEVTFLNKPWRTPHFEEAHVPHSWKQQTSWIRGNFSAHQSVANKGRRGLWVGVTHFAPWPSRANLQPQGRLPQWACNKGNYLASLFQLPHKRNRRDTNPLQSKNTEMSS